VNIMPELPEVETIRKTLRELVIGKVIDEVIVSWPKIIKRPKDEEQFCRVLKGETINEIGRRGKFLKFYLDRYVLVSHLRMEGRYGLYPKIKPIEPHTHVIFRFQDETELRYRDVRKFGTMHLFQKGEEEKHPPLSQLGMEPFSEQFTAERLMSKLQSTSRNIKAVLLDQKIVAGLGNIYVDEVLFRSGIHPERMAKDLTAEKVKILHREIIQTLKEAVEKGGSTVRSYVNSQGQIGMFQLDLFVYAREKEQCKICGSPIQKIKIGGRGTHFCSSCQV